MKSLHLILLSVLIIQNLFAQIKEDFNVAETGKRPSSCIDEKGNWFVNWDIGEGAIYFTNYDSLGNPVKESFPFIQSEPGIFSRQAVSGNFITTAWQDIIDTQVHFFYYHIRGNTYNLLTDSVSFNYIFQSSREFSSDNLRYDPDIYFLDDTTYCSVWHGLGGRLEEGSDILDASQSGIFGRIGTLSGWPFGSDSWGAEATDSLSLVISDYGFRHFTDDIVKHSSPRIISQFESPYFTVAWQDDHTGNKRLYSRVFYKDGTPKDSSFIVNEDSTLTNLFYLNLAIAPNGDYVIVWSAEKEGVTAIYWKWYSNDGTAITSSQLITTEPDEVAGFASVDIAIDSNSKAVITWEGKLSGRTTIFAKCFDENRNPIGESFKVSTRSDISSSQIYPNVEIRKNRVYFIWQESGQIWGNILDFDNPASIKGETDKFPDKFRLHQNYPNPFNPSTQIKYSINNPGNVVLQIFDISGRLIKTLFASYQNVGNYSVNFNGNNLSSGIYIYRLSVNGLKKQKKMLLIQ